MDYVLRLVSYDVIDSCPLGSVGPPPLGLALPCGLDLPCAVDLCLTRRAGVYSSPMYRAGVSFIHCHLLITLLNLEYDDESNTYIPALVERGMGRDRLPVDLFETTV